MKFCVENEEGVELYSTLTEECKECLSNFSDKYGSQICSIDGLNCRRSAFLRKDRHIKICSKSVKTTRNFHETVTMFLYFLPYLEKIIAELRQKIEGIEQNYTRVLLHNLVNQNAHTIQLLDQLVPQNERFKDVPKTIKDTSQLIIDNTDKVSLILFKLKKLASSMKAEFSAYKRLRTTDTKIKARVYKLYDVVKIVVHIFFGDLHEKNVYVVIDNYFEKGYFDFEAIRVALYYIFENSSKYSREGSSIHIHFSGNDDFQCIEIDMESLFISKDDATHIFERGFSGEAAKRTGLCGSGLGMYHAKQLIEISGGKVEFIAGKKITSRYLGESYSNNKIKVFIPVVPDGIAVYD